MRVDFEYIESLHAELAKVNAVPFEDLEIYKDGKRIALSEDMIEDWRFMGLNNTTWFQLGFI